MLRAPLTVPKAKPITDIDAEPIAVIETVIDDSTPQLLAYVSELLLEAGAWDVYRAAVQMKKGRTGVQMTVLSSPEKLPALRDLLLRETTTIGLRWRLESKMSLKLPRDGGVRRFTPRGPSPAGAEEPFRSI